MKYNFLFPVLFFLSYALNAQQPYELIDDGGIYVEQ